jgi:hypothetical protein
MEDAPKVTRDFKHAQKDNCIKVVLEPKIKQQSSLLKHIVVNCELLALLALNSGVTYLYYSPTQVPASFKNNFKLTHARM